MSYELLEASYEKLRAEVEQLAVVEKMNRPKLKAHGS
jgi:hypothetical protein